MPFDKRIDISAHHKVAVWKIEESVGQLKHLLGVSAKDEAVVNAFRLDKRKQEWLASRLLLKEILGFYPELIYVENGKPTLANGSSYISISHTDGFAAVSMSDQPTAIDIEKCQARVEKVASRFVHPDEASYIENKKKLNYLTLLWSAKEALYKYYNVYGVIFKEQFKIHPFQLSTEGDLLCDFVNQNTLSKLQLTYLANEAYTLVYC
ncbi:4'-phosphopantetheinyl transferase superfamily protein [Carboxylicivirga sediminis]|uniref:4'-phosphopantetheinyl transferase superfamily protein n=1 Tax=Carboxylicivirga sediminis TaxID=2006564 RepID=A0A941IWS6_9BACT|nr:4'-phosphopantetheinyl transferase superfamily protein [Carboxylicivirga sediminis]MBR8534823.1 4'-phosphopantetheinyl transferase superfamily protein [Carboxylicivirga sediminis]